MKEYLLFILTAIAGISILYAKEEHEVNRLFYEASCNGNIKTLKILLQKGVDMETRQSDPDCWPTPLLCATKMGHEKAVKLSLEAGANANTSDGFSQDNAVRLAAMGGKF